MKGAGKVAARFARSRIAAPFAARSLAHCVVRLGELVADAKGAQTVEIGSLTLSGASSGAEAARMVPVHHFQLLYVRRFERGRGWRAQSHFYRIQGLSAGLCSSLCVRALSDTINTVRVCRVLHLLRRRRPHCCGSRLVGFCTVSSRPCAQFRPFYWLMRRHQWRRGVPVRVSRHGSCRLAQGRSVKLRTVRSDSVLTISVSLRRPLWRSLLNAAVPRALRTVRGSAMVAGMRHAERFALALFCLVRRAVWRSRAAGLAHRASA